MNLSKQNLEQFLLSTPVLILLVLVSIIGAGPFFPLFDLDEGAFSEATREMLASGNWISTYLNGIPRHDKPILIYWFQALSASSFGIHAFAFRLPSMIAAAIWVWVVFRFVREFFNERSARISVWLVSCTWLTCIMFKAATADALLNCLINLILFDIYRYSQNPQNKKLLLIGFYMGLGFLTKGPIAVVLPVAASLIAMSLHGKFKLWLQAVFHPYSWLTLIAVITPWHIAVYLDQGWGFFQGFYLGHNLGRFSETMESHGGSPFYYLVIVPLIVLPLAPMLWRVLGRAWANIKADMLSTYLWAWFILTLLIFSFSQTQLPHYILYGMSPLFILLARQLYLHTSEQTDKTILKFEPYWAAIAASIFIALPFCLGIARDNTTNVYEKAVISLGHDTFYSGFQWICIALLIWLALVVSLKNLTSLSKILLSCLALMLGTNFVLAPVAATAQQRPVYNAAQIAKNFDGKVVSYKATMPSVSVYAQRIINYDRPKLGDLVFTRTSARESLFALDESVQPVLIFEQSGIALYVYGSKAEDENSEAMQKQDESSAQENR